MTSPLDNILSNPGLIDIRDQIFGYFDHETLEVCCEVFAQRFGGDWDVWLKRLASIQYMVEFGNKMVEGKAVKDFIPGWYKGVKKFSNMASLKDLNEVKGIIEKTFEFAWKVRCSSCLCNCHEWSCKANGAFIPHYL